MPSWAARSAGDSFEGKQSIEIFDEARGLELPDQGLIHRECHEGGEDDTTLVETQPEKCASTTASGVTMRYGRNSGSRVNPAWAK